MTRAISGAAFGEQARREMVAEALVTMQAPGLEGVPLLGYERVPAG